MNCWEFYGNIGGKKSEGGRDWHVVDNKDETRFQ
jgi:hypothetical protein